MQYLRERREALGGCLPAAARRDGAAAAGPGARDVQGPARGHGRARDLDDDGVRAHPLDARCATRSSGQHVVPIVARRVAHVRHGGDVPPARDLQPGRPALPARGRRPADVLPRGQERARSSRRASTSRARSPRGSRRRPPTPTTACAMIPFYIYYSMFGFQRVGDLAWAAGDIRARGFLIGGTAGPHDAQRRGAAARGRPQPHPGRARSRTASPTTRPTPTRSR